MKKLISLFIFLISIVLITACGSSEPVEVTLNPGSDTIELDDVWVDAGVTLVQGETELTFYSNTNVNESELGTTIVSYSFTYEGEEYSVERHVHVTDQTNPVLTLNIGLDTVTVGSDWVDAGCEVVDNSDEELTCTTSDTVDTTTTGTYIITYQATDSSGNTGMIKRYVYVVD